MKKVRRVLLAGYVLCWLLLLCGEGILLIGPVSSWDIMWVLFVIGVLALMIWGDVALAKATRGWERGVALTFVLAVEGLALFTLWFFSLYFNTSPEFIPLYGPSGEVELVVCEEKWLFKTWGTFYRPAGPFRIWNTGVTYEAHDRWPFHMGYYELEWAADQAVIRYDTGTGAWETCVVPLD